MLGPLAMMNAAFADRFGERPEPRPAPKTAADVPACGCREPIATDCSRRLCLNCCGYDCTAEHTARDHGADE